MARQGIHRDAPEPGMPFPIPAASLTEKILPDPSAIQTSLFSLLLFGHLVADLWLQPERLAKAKRLRGKKGVLALGIHGSAHGMLTGLILLSPLAATLETMAHAMIDRGKCRGFYGTLPDQAAHILAKVLWLTLFGADASDRWLQIINQTSA